MWCNKITMTIIFILLNFNDAMVKYEEGPFQTIITNTSICSAGPPWFWPSITAYTKKGLSLIRGSFNITKDVEDTKFRLTVHYLKEKNVKVFDMKNQNCHNNIIELILNTVHFRFNKQNCKIKTGYYEFRDLNVDAIIHTVVQSMWYGAMQLRLIVSVRAGLIFCIDIFFRSAMMPR